MKLKTFLFVLALVLGGTAADAQPHQSVYANDFSQRRIVSRPYVREADVAWSKTVWRLIDLREKMNQTLYYPETPIGNYKSLAGVLVDLVQQYGLNIYDENAGDEFAVAINDKDMRTRLGEKLTEITVDEPVTAEQTKLTIRENYSLTDIKRFLIKEVWFFDRGRSVLDVRIIGICPIREYYREEDIDQESPLYKKIGWFYFPEIEPYLVRYPALNGQNEANKWTYYDIFRNRYFSSLVVQVGNLYNNRRIEDYALGTDALLEALRVENDIRDFEESLWEY